MKWRRVSGVTKCYLRFWTFWQFPKISQIFHFFYFFSKFPPQNTNFQKTVQYVRGQWLMNMCTKFQVDFFKMAEIWHKTCQKQALYTSFRDFTVIFRILFVTDFDVSKSDLGSFFAFFAKIWPENMHRSSKSQIFLLDLFYLVTWHDLDLYYGRKAQ